MIQPTAPAPLPALGLPGDIALLPAGEPAEGLAFGALLALQSPAAVPSEAAEPPLPGAAILQSPAAAPGNILPVVLPEPASAVQPAEPPPTCPQPAATALALRTLKFEAKAGRVQPQPIDADPTVQPDEPAQSVEPAPEPQTLPLPQPDLQTKPVVPALSAVVLQQPPGVAELTPEPQSQGAQHRTIPTLPVSASIHAQAQMLRHVPVTAPLPVEPATQAGQPVPTPPAPAASLPAEAVRIDFALPRLAVAVARGRDELRPLAKLPAFAPAEAGAEALGPLASAPSALQAMPVSPAVSPAPLRPHDFAALIERIAVAREAAAPQAVSITVSHQDFGQVRLSFRPEEAGFNVAISSADPGFARAAAALPAPVLSLATSDQANMSQQQRNDGAPAQTGGQSQSRGGSADPRRDGQSQPHSNPAPRGHSGRAATRSGIFA